MSQEDKRVPWPGQLMIHDLVTTFPIETLNRFIGLVVGFAPNPETGTVGIKIITGVEQKTPTFILMYGRMFFSNSITGEHRIGEEASFKMGDLIIPSPRTAVPIHVRDELWKSKLPVIDDPKELMNELFRNYKREIDFEKYLKRYNELMTFLAAQNQENNP